MLRRTAFALAFWAVFFPAAPNAATAHGVGYRESDMKPLALEFTYSTGDSLSFASAQVFSPLDGSYAWQSGQTDEAGRFAFTPDAAGTWRVVVRDGQGHRAEASVSVPLEFFEAKTESAAAVSKGALPEGTDRVLRSALGVSLLFNIVAAVFAARRQGRRRERAHQ